MQWGLWKDRRSLGRGCSAEQAGFLNLPFNIHIKARTKHGAKKQSLLEGKIPRRKHVPCHRKDKGPSARTLIIRTDLIGNREPVGVLKMNINDQRGILGR